MKILLASILLAITATFALADRFPITPPRDYPTYVGTKENPLDLTNPSPGEIDLLCNLLSLESIYGPGFGNPERHKYICDEKFQESQKTFLNGRKLPIRAQEEKILRFLIEYKYGSPKNPAEEKALLDIPENTIPESVKSVKNLKYALIDISDSFSGKPYDTTKGGLYFNKAVDTSPTNIRGQARLPKKSGWKTAGNIYGIFDAFVKIPSDKAEKWANCKKKSVQALTRIIFGTAVSRNIELDTETLRFIGDGETIAEVPWTDVEMITQ